MFSQARHNLSGRAVRDIILFTKSLLPGWLKEGDHKVPTHANEMQT